MNLCKDVRTCNGLENVLKIKMLVNISRLELLPVWGYFFIRRSYDGETDRCWGFSENIATLRIEPLVTEIAGVCGEQLKNWGLYLWSNDVGQHTMVKLWNYRINQEHVMAKTSNCRVELNRYDAIQSNLWWNIIEHYRVWRQVKGHGNAKEIYFCPRRTGSIIVVEKRRKKRRPTIRINLRSVPW